MNQIDRIMWRERAAIGRAAATRDGPKLRPTAARTRRSLPPELVNAIDIERLRWTMRLKGIEATAVEIVAGPRRVGVRLRGTGDPKTAVTLSLSAALAEIERRWPTPELLVREAHLRARALALERWLLKDVGGPVVASLVHLMGVAHGGLPLASRVVIEPAAADVIRRALDLVAGLTQRHAYLLGGALTFTDIAAAAVLAPIARLDGWEWAGRGWTPLAAVAGRSDLARHRGAAWVRDLYRRHGEPRGVSPDLSCAWVP
jgi:hypothetical protein